MKDIIAMIRLLSEVIASEIAAGKPREDAMKAAEITLRREYGGERIHIAAFPRQEKQARIERWATCSTREIATSPGITVRGVRKITRGR